MKPHLHNAECAKEREEIHMEKFMKEVSEKVFKVSANGVKLHQTDAMQLKADFNAQLKDLLVNAGVDVLETHEGLAIQLHNAELGAVTVCVDGVVKSLVFDAVLAHEVFVKEKELKLAEKLEKEKAKQVKIKAKATK